MNNGAFIGAILGIIAFFIHELLQSHKNHKALIKRLHKKISRNVVETGNWERTLGLSYNNHDNQLIRNMEEETKRMKNLVNALLDYHYFGTEDEEEKEYVLSNKYDHKNNEDTL